MEPPDRDRTNADPDATARTIVAELPETERVDIADWGDHTPATVVCFGPAA